MNKILVEAGLAVSGTEASRRIKENAVRVNDKTITQIVVTILANVERILRVGKKMKRIVIFT
jgi:tyrosyl-tRNA synthetase